MAKRTKKAPSTPVRSALTARRRTRKKFALTRKELDKRLAKLPALDKLAKKYPPTLKTGEFLKKLREKYGVAAEGLRQLRFARDRLGLKVLRHLALAVGMKGAIVIATIESADKRTNLIRKGLPVARGQRQHLQFATLRELEAYARKLRKRPADRYPGPQARWPHDLPGLLRKVAQRFEQLKESAYRLHLAKAVFTGPQNGETRTMPSAQTLQKLKDMLSELQELLGDTIGFLDDDRSAQASARAPRRDG